MLKENEKGVMDNFPRIISTLVSVFAAILCIRNIRRERQVDPKSLWIMKASAFLLISLVAIQLLDMFIPTSKRETEWAFRLIIAAITVVSMVIAVQLVRRKD